MVRCNYTKVNFPKIPSGRDGESFASYYSDSCFSSITKVLYARWCYVEMVFYSLFCVVRTKSWRTSKHENTRGENTLSVQSSTTPSVCSVLFCETGRIAARSVYNKKRSLLRCRVPHSHKTHCILHRSVCRDRCHCGSLKHQFNLNPFSETIVFIFAYWKCVYVCGVFFVWFVCVCVGCGGGGGGGGGIFAWNGCTSNLI